MNTKKGLFTSLLLVVSCVLFAQTDKIYKHNGEVISGKVAKVTEEMVIFSYENEDSQSEIGKYAVEKIIYSKSGRIEDISEKIEINSIEDWEKVVIIEEIGYVSGLKKGGEIKGKTSYVNFHTGATGDKKAEKKMKIEAVEMGCPYILMVSEKNTVGSSSNQLGGSQVIKKGIGYKY